MNQIGARVFFDPKAKSRPYRVVSDGEELCLTREEALTVALEAWAKFIAPAIASGAVDE